jgi:hypothetical protein
MEHFIYQLASLLNTTLINQLIFCSLSACALFIDAQLALLIGLGKGRLHQLTKLFKKQLAKVKVAGILSEWFRVSRGVGQGCVLYPYYETSWQIW